MVLSTIPNQIYSRRNECNVLKAGGDNREQRPLSNLALELTPSSEGRPTVFPASFYRKDIHNILL
jgi:hypothetical protein